MTPTTLVTLTRTVKVSDNPRPYIYQTTFEVENGGDNDDTDLMDCITKALDELGQPWRMIPHPD